MINLETTHARIASGAETFLRDLYGERLKNAGTGQWRVGKHGSLALSLKDNRLLFHDHEAGEGGDAIDLWAREKQCTTIAAMEGCAAWAGVTPIGAKTATIVAKPRAPKPEPQPFVMSAAELQRANLGAQRLGTDAKLCARIAKARGWKAETIQRLAWDCALGWDVERLAFIYETGIKLRWQVNGERVIKWAFGNGSSFWRGHMRQRCTRAAIICEGETDAIRLVDLGADTPERRVYAVPSASTWPADWKRAIAGLDEVTFATDNDKAGQQHLAEWAETIRPHVGKVRSIDWKAVLA